MKYDRDIILRDLKMHVVEVQFTKVNGETRTMRCTLMPEHLPVTANIEHLDEQHKKPENLNTIAAWDVSKGGWRSFRIDSVEYVQIIESY
jgi:uncharacterized cupin superfamily protein